MRKLLMIYNRKSTEIFKDYKLRLCRNKEEYELNWNQVTNLLNAETDKAPCSETTYRKWYNPYEEGYSDGLKDAANSDALINRIKNEKHKFEVAKQEFLDERRELLKEKRSVTRTEWMSQKIQEVTTPLSPIKPYVILKPSNKHPRRTLCVLHSDGQVGELIQPPDTAGFNTYDVETFIRRDGIYANNVVQAIYDFDVEAVKVLQLGDSVEGNGRIYKRQRNYLDEFVIKQIFRASEAEARFVEAVVGTGVKDISVSSVAGNHGLDGYDSHDNANFEWLVYDRAKLLLKEYNIDYNIADTFMQMVSIYGFNFLCLHGDGIRKSGIDNAFYKYSHMYAQRGMPIYSMVMGHWHSYSEKDVLSSAGSIIINGNIAGSNRLEVERLQLDTKPTQIFFVVEEGVGITYKRKVVLPD